jgi:epoxide hydrolase 4
MSNARFRSILGALLSLVALAPMTFAAKPDTPAFTDEYVQANGLRLHVVTNGKGPLILFLHGFPEFWYEWKNQLQEFGNDYLAVAPDLPGYNLSDKPADLAQYRIEPLVEDIRQLADHYRNGQKFILVGHDWGGALAWAFAIAHPDYLQKLVIINAPHPGIFGKLLASNPDQQQASQYMLLFRSPQAEAMLSANNYSLLVDRILREGGFPEEDTPIYLKAWSQPGALTGGLNYYRANHVGPPVSQDAESQIGPSSSNFGVDPALLVVKVPTLVLWGERDTALTVHNLEGLDAFVPQLTIQRFSDASHWVVHEKPAEVNAAIRKFIASSPAPAVGGQYPPNPPLVANGGAGVPASQLGRTPRIRVTSDVLARQITHTVNPVRTQEMNDQHLQGKVTVHVVVGTDGKVLKAEAVSGNPVLAKAAVDAVLQWQFRSTLLNGQPVEVDSTVDIVFSLNP